MNEVLTIQIPYDLARYAAGERQLVKIYQTNQVIKAIGTWLVLKADAPGSLIQSWNDQKQYLFKICKCSESIFRHRLQLLKKMHLVTFDKNNIRLCSWKDLAAALNIDIENKFIINYEIDSKQKVHQWILATEITDNQSRQAYMILKTVKKNPELRMILIGAMLKAGADRNRLDDQGYFIGQLHALYLQDFVRASDIHQELIEVRPDTNRSVKGMAAAWNCKHAMTVSYWKKILSKAGIIDVAKMQVRSSERVRNKHCKVLWLKQAQETLLCLCDQITVLQPWLIQNLMAA